MILRNIVCTSVRYMLVLGKRAADLSEGRAMAEKSIADGAALEKLRVLVQAQGGDVSYVDDPSKFPEGGIRRGSGIATEWLPVRDPGQDSAAKRPSLSGPGGSKIRPSRPCGWLHHPP